MSLLLAGIILLGGSIVQGAIGFALGMIAVPLLVEAGFSLSQSVALTTLAIGIQVLFGAWKLRTHIPWSEVKLAAAVRYLTVPVGVLLLLSVESMDTGRSSGWWDWASCWAWSCELSPAVTASESCRRRCLPRCSASAACCKAWWRWAARRWCCG